MGNKIKIAELEIDDKALIKSTSDVKKAIDELKAAQKSLTAEGDTSSKAYVKNAADLKVLNSAYSGNIKALAEMTQATVDAANRNELMTLALNEEVMSIQMARDQNKILNKIRNETNTLTAEGRAEIELLNKKLDSNNEYIKENADQYLQQKINIGNYSESIKDALNSLNPFNQGLGGFVQRSQEAGGVMPLLQNGLKGVITGVWGLIKASLAFIATPIGAVIAAVAAVFFTLYSVFKNFQPILDKVEQGFAALGAVLNVIKTTIVAVATGAKDLGSIFSGLGGEMKKAAAEAVAFTKAQQDLDDAMEKQEITSARNRAEIEKLNTLAKDKTKTDTERIALLKQAEELETKDYNQRLKNAKEEERITLQKIKSAAKLNDAEYAQLVKSGFDYKTIAESKGMAADELFTKLKENQVKLAGLDQQYNVNLEKGINKQNKLIEDAQAEKEKAQALAIENASKALDLAIEKNQTELDLFIARQGYKKMSLNDELTFSKSIMEKELANLNFLYKKKQVSELEYQTQKLEILNAFAQTQAEIAVDAAGIELQNHIDKNKTLLENNKFLSDDLYLQEVARLDALKQAEDEFQLTKLTEGVINLQEYDAAITAIDAENLKKKQDLETQRKDAEKEQKILDLENERIINDENFIIESEIKAAQLEAKRLQEVANAEKTGADVTLINQKYAKAQKDIDQSVKDFKMNSALETFKMVSGLFGQQTVLGKAAALADVGITTYKKAFESFAQAKVYFSNPLTATLGVNAAIQGGLTIASGAATAAKIAGVKFEKGGIQEIGGKSHSQGGTKFYGEDGTMFEAQSGEGIGILNRSAYAGFMDFNNSFNGGQSGNGKFAGGGIITQGVRPNGDNITQALQSMNIMVAVEDINRGQGSYAKVIEGANS